MYFTRTLNNDMNSAYLLKIIKRKEYDRITFIFLKGNSSREFINYISFSYPNDFLKFYCYI